VWEGWLRRLWATASWRQQLTNQSQMYCIISLAYVDERYLVAIWEIVICSTVQEDESETQSINFNLNIWTTANRRLHEKRFIWRFRYFYCHYEIYYIFCLAYVRHYIHSYSYLLLELFYDTNYFLQINKLKVYSCQRIYKDD